MTDLKQGAGFETYATEMDRTLKFAEHAEKISTAEEDQPEKRKT